MANKFRLIFIISLVIVNVTSSKLNVPRVLLPIFSDFSTKFTLEAVDGGCYKWTTTRNDIVELNLINKDPQMDCSSKAIVSAISKEDARNLAVILAEDVNTGQMLKCDVVVDVIHSLTITTTTKELFMEEVPESFQVNAYDVQGNEFSTLEGVEFTWNINTFGPKKHTDILHYVPFKDSSYETPSHVKLLEEQGKTGSMILLEGIKTGSAKISVRLPYSEYKHVEPTEVLLTVIANLLLTPAETYLMVGDVISYKVFYMNSGRMQEIKLPDAQYYLGLEDTELASINSNSNEVTGVNEGRTTIVLHNRNVNESDPALKLPSAIINVVQPAYIALNILPHRNWAILIGDKHEIIAEIFTSTDHKLHIGPGVELQIQIAEGFHVNEKSKNSSWVSGWGINETVVPIWVTLEKINHRRLGKFWLNKPLKASADLLIYPRITITPSEVILPWDPQLKPKYNIDLVAKGGDGKFIWSSNDHTIGVVTQSGHVRTHTNGNFEITAAMSRNPHNRQTVPFSILPPNRLEIVEYVMEQEIGSPVHLHVALFADNNEIEIPFTQCQQLPFQIKQSDNKFKQNKTDVVSPIVGISCGNIAMVGLHAGASKITVSYYQDGKVLEDSVTVNAYKPLKLLLPESDVVLAIGTTINLVYTGGPKPVLGRDLDHQKIIVTENSDIVQVKEITKFHQFPIEDVTVIEVLCKKLGTTRVKLMINNIPVLPNCKTKASVVTTIINCGKPRKIRLQPEIKIADAQSCPMDLSRDRVIVRSNDDLLLDVNVLNEFGKKFLNLTSLLFKWEVEPINKVLFVHKDSIYPTNFTFGTVLIANKTQQMIKPLSAQGRIEINSTIMSYNQKILNYYHIKSEYPEFKTNDENDLNIELKTSLALFLVDDTIVTPNHTSVFNYPGNKRMLSVQHGSGYYEIGLNYDNIANVRYIESCRELEIIPNKSGQLIIKLIDLCLISRPVFINVDVISAKLLRVEMSDRVEINRCIQCILRLYDFNDNLITINDPDMVNLNYEFTNNIVSVEKISNNLTVGEIRYLITGVELGDTKLSFSLYSTDGEVVSAPVDLQVFLPLQIHPRNSTLLIGSVLQLNIKGGPKPDSHIEFFTQNENIATIDEDGVIVGQAIGNTRLHAKSVGIHPMTGKRIVYSEDTVDLRVIALTGIKISAPLTRFKVGGIVPCWISGIPEQITPLILGTINEPSILYDWAVTDNNVVEIDSIFQSIGINYLKEDLISIRLIGLQPGKTKLNVNVTISGAIVNKPKKSNVILSASLDIEIFDALNLISPDSFTGRSLLMAPFSSLQLRTNLDKKTQVIYSLSGNGGQQLEATQQSLTVVNDLISLNSNGYLQAHGNLGKTMLTITSTDEFGLKQTIEFVVEIKPTHYMMLNLVAEWRIENENILRNLPLGTEFNLRAKFYDDVGNEFDAGLSNLELRSSRCDLINIKGFNENSSIIISSRKSGNAIIKAWADGIESTTDYVKLHIEQAIKPTLDHLTTGDIICLWTPVVTKYYQLGKWETSDKRLVVIDKTIDVAFVIGKDGNIFISHNLHPAASLKLPILAMNRIVLLPVINQILTNGPQGTTFNVPVILHSQKSLSTKMSNLIQGWRCQKDVLRNLNPVHFTCNILISTPNITYEAKQLFVLSTAFISKTGQYACALISTGTNDPGISTIEANISIIATTIDGEIKSQPLEIPFIPNFYVESEVLLDETSNIGQINVIGLNHILTEVQVTPIDSSIIFVDKGYFLEPTKLSFQVQLIDYHWRLAELAEAMGVVVVCPRTDQSVTVMVKVTSKIGGQHCGLNNSSFYVFVQNYKHAIIVFISMFVIFLITAYLYSRYMKPVTNTKFDRSRLLGMQARYPVTSSPIVRCGPVTPTFTSNVTKICSHTSPCNCRGLRQPVYGESLRNSSFLSNSDTFRRNRKFI